MVELKVLKVFRDKNNPEKLYKEGDTFRTEDLDRVNDLVARKICVIVSVEAEKPADGSGSAKVSAFGKEWDPAEVKEALNTVGIPIAKNAGVTGVSKKLAELTEEESKAVAEILCKD